MRPSVLRHSGLVVVGAVAVIACMGGCGGPRVATDLHQPAMLYPLPAAYHSPDGMSIGPDGSIYLSMNNAGAEYKYDHPAKIMRLAPDDKLYEFANLVPGSESKVGCPLGNAWGSDGNLYVADAQCFKVKTPNSSRMQRVVVKDGKAVRTEVVATGLQMANGVATKGDSVYICDSQIDTSVSPIVSGVYRIKLDELSADKPLRLTGLNDPHLVVKLQTQHPEHKVGANGLGFDSLGNMYVCNFGDREVWKATFKADGSLDEFKLLAKDGGMESCDGLQPDKDDNLWVADFLGNAIFKIDSKSGQVTMIAKNGHEGIDIASGALHAPSECIRRGNRVYVSNIDIDYGENKAHDIQNLSVITLTE